MRPSSRFTFACFTLVLLPSCRLGYELVPSRDDNSSSASGGLGGEASDGGAAGVGGFQSDTGGMGGGSPTGGAASGGAGSGGMGIGGTGTGGVPFGAEPYCDKLHLLSDPPIIDGLVDGSLPLQPIVPQAFRFHADNPEPYKSLPAGVSMSYAAAWRPDGLYFFLDIVDPNYVPAPDTANEWAGDGAEIYVDHDAVFAPPGSYDALGTNSFIFEAPPVSGDLGIAAGYYTPYARQGDFAGQWISQKTPSGYVVEAFIAASDLGMESWTISVESSLAFDLGHNVSFPEESTATSDFNRLGQYFLQVADPFTDVEADYPFYNSAVFCTPEIADQ